MLRLNLEKGKVVEAKLIGIDPISKAVVLENDDTFEIFFPSAITSMGEFPNTLKDENISGTSSLGNLEKREQLSLEHAENSIAGVNFAVPPEIQTLYDRLSFIFPCRWSGNSIIILDQCVIEPPYDASSLRSLTTSNVGMDRFIKILEGERRKLGITA